MKKTIVLTAKMIKESSIADIIELQRTSNINCNLKATQALREKLNQSNNGKKTN